MFNLLIYPEKDDITFPVRKELKESNYPVIYEKPLECVVASLMALKSIGE